MFLNLSLTRPLKAYPCLVRISAKKVLTQVLEVKKFKPHQSGVTGDYSFPYCVA
jgi:hypothetical protein